MRAWRLAVSALLAGVFSGAANAQDILGTLHCLGASGAEVYVDGELAGAVPFSTELSDGEHTFRVAYNDGDTFEFVEAIDFRAAETQALEIPEIPRASPYTPSPEPLLDKGMVNLFGVTGSRVSIDGDPAGTIPSSVFLSAGEHTLQVTLPDGTEFTRTEVVRFTGSTAPALALTPP